MSILRHNFFWLSYRTKKHLKKEHKELFNSLYLEFVIKIYNVLISRKNWFLVFALVVSFFSVSSFINFEILNVIEFDSNIAKSIIDTRTTNLAAIISMSLVVVGFLITNLAMKSSTTIKLLFKKSYIYFTLYLTFSTISCFIILSNLRNTLNDFVFSRAVLAGTYLCVLILFLIGILFRNIIHFTDELKISNMLKRELLEEGKKKLKNKLFEKYSNELLENILSKDCNKYDFFQNFSLNNILGAKNVTDNNKAEEKYLILKDVNLVLLSVFVFFKKINKNNKLYYTSLKINEQFNYNNDIIWADNKENTKFEKWFLKRCLITKNRVKQEQEDIYRNEFDQKIIQLAEEGKYRNLSYPLDAYLEFYELQMKNQK